MARQLEALVLILPTQMPDGATVQHMTRDKGYTLEQEGPWVKCTRAGKSRLVPLTNVLYADDVAPAAPVKK